MTVLGENLRRSLVVTLQFTFIVFIIVENEKFRVDYNTTFLVSLFALVIVFCRRLSPNSFQKQFYNIIINSLVSLLSIYLFYDAILIEGKIEESKQSSESIVTSSAPTPQPTVPSEIPIPPEPYTGNCVFFGGDESYKNHNLDDTFFQYNSGCTKIMDFDQSYADIIRDRFDDFDSVMQLLPVVEDIGTLEPWQDEDEDEKKVLRDLCYNNFRDGIRYFVLPRCSSSCSPMSIPDFCRDTLHLHCSKEYIQFVQEQLVLYKALVMNQIGREGDNQGAGEISFECLVDALNWMLNSDSDGDTCAGIEGWDDSGIISEISPNALSLNLNLEIPDRFPEENPGNCSYSTWSNWKAEKQEAEEFNAKVKEEIERRNQTTTATGDEETSMMTTTTDVKIEIMAGSSEPTRTTYPPKRFRQLLLCALLTFTAQYLTELLGKSSKMNKTKPILDGDLVQEAEMAVSSDGMIKGEGTRRHPKTEVQRNTQKSPAGKLKKSQTVGGGGGLSFVDQKKQKPDIQKGISFNDTDTPQIADRLTLISAFGPYGLLDVTIIYFLGAILFLVGRSYERKGIQTRYDAGEINFAALLFYLAGIFVIDRFLKVVVFWRDYARKHENFFQGGSDIDSKVKRLKFKKLISAHKFYIEKFSIAHNGDWAYLVVLFSEVFEMALQLFNINNLCTTMTWDSLADYNTIVGLNEVVLGLIILIRPTIKAGTLTTVDIIFDLSIVYFNLQVDRDAGNESDEQITVISTLAVGVPLLRSLRALEWSLYHNVHTTIGKHIMSDQFAKDEVIAKREGSFPDLLAKKIIDELNKGEEYERFKRHDLDERNNNGHRRRQKGLQRVTPKQPDDPAEPKRERRDSLYRTALDAISSVRRGSAQSLRFSTGNISRGDKGIGQGVKYYQQLGDGENGEVLTGIVMFHLKHATPLQVLNFSYTSTTPEEATNLGLPVEDVVQVYSERHRCTYHREELGSQRVGVAPRDACYDSIFVPIGKDKFLVAHRSCLHQEKPASAVFVRKQIYFFGIFLSESIVDKGCDVVMIMSANHGLKMPDVVSNSVCMAELSRQMRGKRVENQ